jgi:hypothetical protein
MPPERKFNAAILSITLAIMAAAITYLPKLTEERISKPLEIAVSILTGTGLYEALSRLIEFLLRRSRRLKRWILGRSYAEGKWAGYWVNRAGQPRFVIEHIRQEWDTLIMTGLAFDENMAPYGHWQSSNAMIDGDRGDLRGVFSGDIGGRHYDSIITFRLEGNPPCRMTGFVADAVGAANPGQAWLFEQKVDDRARDSEILQTAVRMYTARAAETVHGVPKAPPAAAGPPVPTVLGVIRMPFPTRLHACNGAVLRPARTVPEARHT